MNKKNYDENDIIVDVIMESGSIYPNCKGLVAGYNYDIGITIVDAHDHNRYLICLSGPSSILWTKYCTKESYEIAFKLITNMIENKKIVIDQLIDMYLDLANVKEDPISISKLKREVRGASAESCPFAQ